MHFRDSGDSGEVPQLHDYISNGKLMGLKDTLSVGQPSELYIARKLGHLFFVFKVLL